ncbi:MAG TPA: methylated-DNA--[protein]-cysteine S-methyltransferase [Gemmatimonadaceae bacterium]|nr:methylated-DNA--[protein]-cysteine S-methyltransferase [Gemmatimonadaceae bacterium]
MSTAIQLRTRPDPPDDAAWRAVLAGDAAFDGRFVYAVRTMGVYCRPSCPARRPLRRNVAFFPTPAAAEADGFRACRRCGGVPRVQWMTLPSALGRVLVAATARGVCAVFLGDDEAALVPELARRYPRAALARGRLDGDFGRWTRAVVRHVNGESPALDVPLDPQGTPFQRRVWDALRTIPFAETRSYAEVARAVGAPRAVRAVAAACAGNPVALAIPCHRVVREDGRLAGFRWGIERKRLLLEQERALAARGAWQRPA